MVGVESKPDGAGSDDRLTVTGDVDETVMPDLRDTIESVSQGYTRGLAIDLSEVTFLPSSAVALLAIAQHRAFLEGGVIDLVARQGTLAQRILATCEIPHRFG
ncbi:STAS domain-containing protein [Nocardioides sp.]|uniref:STAS domain-containing protein n=1 Tax=Nocardioides sp. TaxID=35761 RepID=UPI0027286831|nr:STAS domain-containing protein [Nocardioides sp.]MDO9457591.1 STAS domain-containing protein [Nocardioides sp.]